MNAARFDRFTLRPAPARGLLWLNLLVHAALAAVLCQAWRAGYTPGTAVLWALALLPPHAWLEHRRLTRQPVHVEVDEAEVRVHDVDGTCTRWRLRQVHCVARALCALELAALDAATRPRRRLWVLGGDQLDEVSARRLLRWLRAGPRAAAGASVSGPPPH